MSSPLNIVMLSTAEWDNPFWTNKQHTACSLAKAGHRIFYIESLGLRSPSAGHGRDWPDGWSRAADRVCGGT